MYDDHKKEIYVFGGLGQGYDFLKHCEKYSVLNDVWTKIAPIKKAKFNASACIMNNEIIYLIGGYNNSSYLNDIKKYSIANNTW